MIRSIALLAVFLATACAAETYIDLSGDWRKSPDDRPEYANADVDDSAWKIMRLPRRVGDSPASRAIEIRRPSFSRAVSNKSNG